MITDKLYKFNSKTSRRIGITWKIILINVVAFILINITLSMAWLFKWDSDYIIKLFAMPVGVNELLYRPWTLITFMFLHIDFWHILFNMLWLYWMAKILKIMVSDTELIKFYVYGSLAGALLVFLSYAYLFPGSKDVGMGASAGVMAIIVGAGIMLPNYNVNLLFIGPVKLKWIVIITFCLSCLFELNNNTVGKIAHLGGAIFGFIYAKYILTGFRFQKEHTKPRNDDEYREYFKDKNAEIDSYLEKIHKGGYNSLSAYEKERLKSLSGN